MQMKAFEVYGYEDWVIIYSYFFFIRKVEYSRIIN